MNKVSTTTLRYYLMIGSVLVVQALFTVYQGSVMIGHSQQLSRLEQQKNKLAEQQRQLKVSLSAQYSLTQITQNSLYSEFQPITKPLAINGLQTVAYR